MSRQPGADGVQVVGGSNPPCPTKQNPNPPNNFAAPAAPFESTRRRSAILRSDGDVGVAISVGDIPPRRRRLYRGLRPRVP